MLLRKLADHGQAILCTIHQPSSQLFQMFDRLLLLGRGGQTLYFGDIGENSTTVIDYFERNGASRCLPGANPAEWILTETSGPVTSTESSESAEHKPEESTPIDWRQIWRASQERAELERQLSGLRALAHDTASSPQQATEYATPWVRQLVVVSKRIFQEQWRDPVYLYSKMALCAGVVSSRPRQLTHSSMFHLIADSSFTYGIAPC